MVDWVERPDLSLEYLMQRLTVLAEEEEKKERELASLN